MSFLWDISGLFVSEIPE